MGAFCALREEGVDLESDAAKEALHYQHMISDASTPTGRSADFWVTMREPAHDISELMDHYGIYVQLLDTYAGDRLGGLNGVYDMPLDSVIDMLRAWPKDHVER